MIFDAELVSSVIEHMNEDHSDACLLIARAFSSHRSAIKALLCNFDERGLDMQLTDADQISHMVRITFDKPLTREGQIRGTLVAMTKKARSALATSDLD